MSSDTADRPRRRDKRSNNADFWRAIRFLAPYRGMVIVSILCAVMVSAVFTSGLGAMLPVFKVLLEDQTVAQWVDHQIAEHRLGAKIAERSDAVVLTKVSANGTAAAAGYHAGDTMPLSLEAIALADGMTLPETRGPPSPSRGA